MNEEQLKVKIAEHMALIKYSGRGINEAAERACAFLIITALILEEKRICEDDLAKIETLVSASQFQAYSRAKGNTTDKRMATEQDQAHATWKESKAQCENKIKLYKGYIQIFENAHVSYRQFSRE